MSDDPRTVSAEAIEAMSRADFQHPHGRCNYEQMLLAASKEIDCPGPVFGDKHWAGCACRGSGRLRVLL